ncbi:VOC domain-containing protein [Citrus sinensis]|nr:VOC domain-containing protein [Citrus sinensis]
MKESVENPLCLKSLNHISLVCRSVEASLDFYQNVLGFFPIRRPGSFDFDGAWLFNYGMGIHLLKSEEPDNLPKAGKNINPKDNHISFQCENMAIVERRLKEMKIDYVKSRVEEGGINVDQLFFHDPDGSMIEICNCDVLPVVPLAGDAVRIRSCTSTCENMATVERKLTEMKIEYVKSRVEEGGIYVDQVFFHDPDGSMIEICNCDVLPVVPLAGDTIRSCSIVNCNIQQRNSSGRFNNANETAMPF